MGGISAGTGLFSGIDSRSLIDQLLAIDARPKAIAQKRIIQLQQQQAAFLGLNTAILSFRTAAGNFASQKVFESNKAVSSNRDVLTAVAGTRATPGSYQFTVNRLVSTQQVLSHGFTDSDASGIGATRFTFETGGGSLVTETNLSDLNGGAGVSRGKLTISVSGGSSATVDLSTAITIDDVLEQINAAGVGVTARASGDGLVLAHDTGSEFTVANVAGYTTAQSLGIAGVSASGTLTGSRIRTLSEGMALSVLNDGAGVNIRDGAADLRITDRVGNVINVDLGEIQTTVEGETTITQSRATTLRDVVNIINARAQEANSELRASIDTVNNRLVINDDAASPTGNLIIQSGTSGRTTAEDLGIVTAAEGVDSSTLNGRRLLSGINSALVGNLGGGQGITADELTVTDRAGNSATITLSAAALGGSVADIIRDINQQLASEGVLVSTSLNRAGNGLAITDNSGGSSTLSLSGSAATALGISATNNAGGHVEGSNLQLRWVGRATKLSTLNAGKGIGTGEFRITNSAGQTRVFTVNSNQKTVDDLIQFINAQNLSDVTARINANGDGIELVDTSGGAGKLTVADTSGSVARNLNLVGEFSVADGVAVADGSYERVVEFNATDTLQQVADKIRSANVGVAPTIINDGNGASPFRLSFTALNSGRVGRVGIDTGGLDLGLRTLAAGDDSLVFFGSSDPARAVALTGSSNVLDNVVQGVTIDLNSTSTTPVELVISRDSEKIEKAIDDFVKAFNDIMDAISTQSRYNQETNTRGPLLGDSTTNNIRNTLLRTVQGPAQSVSGEYQRLFQVGIRIGSGTKLEFDRDRFREAFERDPQNVRDLFGARDLLPREPVQVAPGITVAATEDTYSRLGVAEQLKLLGDNLTNRFDGVLTRRGQTIDQQLTLQRTRISNVDTKLGVKRQKLERQFLSMEQAIASLQTQQRSLGQIQSFGG